MRTTIRGTPVVVAPGKLFLVGEYAVLDGGTAVVAATTRQAVAQYMIGCKPESPLVAESVRAAAAAAGERASALPWGSVLVNTEEFSERDTKLGLGSSAAAATAAVGAVFEVAGMPVAHNRDLLFATADAAHRAAQGGLGSGADVAASVYGGVIKFVRPPGAAPTITSLSMPSTLQTVVFWTGHATSTGELVKKVLSFARGKQDLWDGLMRPLKAEADRFVAALLDSNVAGVITAAQRYYKGLSDLGDASSVSIVTPAFRQAAEIAEGLGGAAKPSGAGNGDVGVAFFSDPGAAGEFTFAAAHAGLRRIEVGIATNGVRRRLVGPSRNDGSP